MKKEQEKSGIVSVVIFALVMALVALGLGITNFVVSLEPAPAPYELPDGALTKLPVGVLRLRSGQIQAYTKDYAWIGLDSEGITMVTGDWTCVNKIIEKNTSFPKSINTLQAQLDCLESGGHKWEFVKKGKTETNGRCTYIHSEDMYFFKCSKCGRRKVKELNELTDDEISALRWLNILN